MGIRRSGELGVRLSLNEPSRSLHSASHSLREREAPVGMTICNGLL